jgi:hypothetical protein
MSKRKTYLITWDQGSQTGGNRSGPAGSRWNRSGPVQWTGPVPTPKPCLKFLPLGEPDGFFNRGNLPSHGSVNPAWDDICVARSAGLS